jgi:hypothetical protein
MKNVVRTLLLSVVMGAAIFALAGTADASHMKLDVVAPSQLTVGDSVDIQAVLHAAHGGEAVAGAAVTFYMDGSFGGIDGEVILGQAITDENGVAVLSYQPRSAGEHQLRVEYLTPGAGEPEETTWSHTVTGATGQLYMSSAGVQIPGLNVWLLIAVVAAVWVILLSVAVRVIAIANAPTDAGARSPASPSRATGDW